MLTQKEIDLLDRFLNGDSYDKKELDELKKKVEYLNKSIKLTELFQKQSKELAEKYDMIG